MIFGNMGEMMKMAREMQGKMKEIKKELAREIFEGASGGVVAMLPSASLMPAIRRES